jgi:hypothetical protein
VHQNWYRITFTFGEIHVKQTAAAMLTLLGILPHIRGKISMADDSRYIFLKSYSNNIYVLNSQYFIRNCYGLAQSHRNPSAKIPNRLSKGHYTSQNAFPDPYSQANAKL